MNRPPKDSWRRLGLILLCAALAGEFLLGMFPFSPVEGDEQAVINGLHEMTRPQEAELRWRYEYPLQAGSSWAAIGLHTVTGIDVGRCYFILSAVGSAGFALLAAALIAELAGVSFLAALALALLCQEIQRAGFYANTSTIGGCLSLGGLLLVVRGQGRTSSLFGAGVLFGLGAWCRLDCLVITPAVPVVFWRQMPLMGAGRKTLVAAAVTIVTLGGALTASHVTAADIFSIFAARGDNIGYRPTLEGFGQISSAALVIAAIWGAVENLRRRDLWPLAIFGAVLIPSLYLYGRSLESPKYFYCLTPFLALLSACGLRNLGPAGLMAWGGIAGLELLTGVRTTRTEFRRFTPEPTWAMVAPLHWGASRLIWVVGPGELLGNSDGLSVRTGIGFAGIVWHREKERALQQLGALSELIDQHGQLALLTSTYASYNCSVGDLRASGYRWIGEQPLGGDGLSHLDRWVNGPRNCWLAWINEGPEDPGPIFAGVADRFQNLPEYFFNDDGDFNASKVVAAPWVADPILPRTDGFFALYRVEKSPAGKSR